MFMQDVYGKFVWVFPDGELPPAGDFELKGHESVIILNMTQEKASVKLTLFFENQEPVQGIEIQVQPERVRCIRMDNPEDIGGMVIPRETQYAMKFESSVPVGVQYGRLDTRDQPMAFYINSGYGA